MTTATIDHPSLGTTLHGVEKGNIWQFRGLQYASIAHRFASPGAPADISGDVDCTSYGPRCPQNYIDFRHLLRIPEDIQIPEQKEDEFACLNLDVTMPKPAESGASKRKHAVFVMTEHLSADPTNLVKRSIEMGRPIIAVTINYRLNMFAFGDSTSEKNLAFKDQRKALDYIRCHIAGFGGNPDDITLAGESAGAVYCHAHLAAGSPVRQCILQSGSLYLSPPQPRTVAEALIESMNNAVSRLGGGTLRDAPVATLLQVQRELGLVSFYLQAEGVFENWEESFGSVERLLIGDVEYESVLWRNGVESLSGSSISDAFELGGTANAQLRRLYGIVPDRLISSKLGTLDFLSDVRFGLPVDTIVQKWQHARRPVFRYLADEPNPWQASSRAHHAVDLLYLFGSYDSEFQPSAVNVSRSMQKKWIEFICGRDPWSREEIWTFGPCGECKAIDIDALEARRRVRHWEVLRASDPASIGTVYKALATGRLSLLN
ncbi:Alpha/Beta hydrolase protein [Xylariales sp. PMI_506]|nr:Alpha/Beta hydrolase protein [Xylariales sp. PMI_506]